MRALCSPLAAAAPPPRARKSKDAHLGRVRRLRLGVDQVDDLVVDCCFVWRGLLLKGKNESKGDGAFVSPPESSSLQVSVRGAATPSTTLTALHRRRTRAPAG